MKIKTVTIDAEVEQVLRDAKLEGNNLTLQGKLSPQMYKKVMKVLELIGFAWNRKAKCHVGEGDSAAKFSEAMDTGKVVNEKQTFQFFETPKEVATKLAQYACIGAGDRVLEPSAGKGAIIRAIQKECPHIGVVFACELNEKFRNEIIKNEDGSITGAVDLVGQHDFLEHAEKYDRIVMNPPFTGGQDCEHVKHAYDLLLPGGRVVAVMSPAWHSNSTKKFVAFRQWFDGLSANGFAEVAEELESGTFAKSGTDVATEIVILRKPLSK